MGGILGSVGDGFHAPDRGVRQPADDDRIRGSEPRIVAPDYPDRTAMRATRALRSGYRRGGGREAYAVTDREESGRSGWGAMLRRGLSEGSAPQAGGAIRPAFRFCAPLPAPFSGPQHFPFLLLRPPPVFGCVL